MRDRIKGRENQGSVLCALYASLRPTLRIQIGLTVNQTPVQGFLRFQFCFTEGNEGNEVVREPEIRPFRAPARAKLAVEL